MKCKEVKDQLIEQLLEPHGEAAAVPANPALANHLADCGRCTSELLALKLTLNVLDTWNAPEPSAYFDQKMAVRLREEQANPPMGWLEKIRERLLLNTGRQFRPALAAGLALGLALGGGSYFGVSSFNHPQVQASATVNDLQILDNNQQAIQQMDQLLQDDDSNDSNATPPSS